MLWAQGTQAFFPRAAKACRAQKKRGLEAHAISTDRHQWREQCPVQQARLHWSGSFRANTRARDLRGLPIVRLQNKASNKTPLCRLHKQAEPETGRSIRVV